MKRKKDWLPYFWLRTGSGLQPFSGLPIVELAGENRVLIENHLGIEEYMPNRVRVLVGYGTVIIEGSTLEIRQMSAAALVITGVIVSVTLERSIG